MEEVIILTISIFFIDYIYIVICIFFSISNYMMFEFVCSNSRSSTLVDALEQISTTDVVVEEVCSFRVAHTYVCVTFDKFTTMLCLFFGILKYNVVLFLQVALSYGVEPCPLGMDISPPS
jgi:hypothetical protein